MWGSRFSCPLAPPCLQKQILGGEGEGEAVFCFWLRHLFGCLDWMGTEEELGVNCHQGRTHHSAPSP